MRNRVMIAAVLASIASAQAAEWKSLQVIDDRTVCLQFDDLVSVHWGELGKKLEDEKVVTAPLDLDRATNLATYALQGAQIAKIGRKTLPHTFVRFEKYKTNNAFEHFIYLQLAAPLKTGDALNVTLPADFVSSGPTAMSLTFDPVQSRSEAVHVNQFGYLPNGVKFAQLSYWAGDLGGETFSSGAAFHVLDEQSRKSVFHGAIALRKKADEVESGCGEGNFMHADVYEADFSAFKTPGKYVLSIDGVGCSFAFTIGDDVFEVPFVTTLRGMYHQRCGIALTEQFTKWTRDACHDGPMLETDHRYMDKALSEGGNPPTFKLTGEVRTNTWGGWHDAGDWDREGNHGDIPSRLLIAYQLTPDHYTDGQLNIPESGDGIPDIVNEAMWGIDYGRRMQHPDGGVSVGMFESGGPKDGTTAVTDQAKLYFYADEPVATYKYAANAAQLVAVLKKLGRDDLAKVYLDSSLLAFTWAGKNTHDGDEPKVRDPRFEAEAALYLATGDQKFQDAAKADSVTKTGWEQLVEWPKVDQSFGAWTIALLPENQPGLDVKFQKSVRNAVLKMADVLADSTKKHGDRNSFNWWLPLNWGRGSQSDNIALMVAHKLTGDPKYYDAMVNTVNATLGSNPLNMTWITGLGDRSPHQVMQINYWYDPKGVNPGVTPPGPFAYHKGSPAGVWQIGYNWKFIYPDASQWPALELWFENRLCPPTNESVVETQSKTAISLGYLCPPVTR